MKLVDVNVMVAAFRAGHPGPALAALAADHGATNVTYDRDFARFPGLARETPPRG